MTELKPCPFCGGEAELRKVFDYYEVVCNECTSKTDEYELEDEAIEAWNTRPNPWHTGTPTEEGNYIAHLRIKSRDGEFIEYDMTCNLEVLLNYIRCQNESEENYLMVKGWLRYEPYKEKN